MGFGDFPDTWTDDFAVPKAKPAPTFAYVTYKQVDAKYMILDGALEAIDSTTNPNNVEKLVNYWQQELYGRPRN